MRSTSSALLALLLLVSSLQTGEAGNSTLAMRKDYPAIQGVFLCDKPNYTGGCHWQHLDPEALKKDDCVKLTNPGGNGIVSMGPDYSLRLAVFDAKCDSTLKSNLVCPGKADISGWSMFGKDEVWVRATNWPEGFMSNICPYVLGDGGVHV